MAQTAQPGTHACRCPGRCPRGRRPALRAYGSEIRVWPASRPASQPVTLRTPSAGSVAARGGAWGKDPVLEAAGGGQGNAGVQCSPRAGVHTVSAPGQSQVGPTRCHPAEPGLPVHSFHEPL